MALGGSVSPRTLLCFAVGISFCWPMHIASLLSSPNISLCGMCVCLAPPDSSAELKDNSKVRDWPHSVYPQHPVPTSGFNPSHFTYTTSLFNQSDYVDCEVGYFSSVVMLNAWTRRWLNQTLCMSYCGRYSFWPSQNSFKRSASQYRLGFYTRAVWTLQPPTHTYTYTHALFYTLPAGVFCGKSLWWQQMAGGREGSTLL